MTKLAPFTSIKFFDSFLNDLTDPTYSFTDFSSLFDSCRNKVKKPILYLDYDSSVLDYKEIEDNAYLELSIPGIKKENVIITVNDKFLEIKAENKSKNQLIQRKYSISKNIDVDNIYAKIEDGILYLTFPLKSQEKEKPKIIKIE